MVTTTGVEGDYKKIAAKIPKFFDDIGTPMNRKLKASGDVIERPITNIQSSNKIIYIGTVFLVRFWDEE